MMIFQTFIYSDLRGRARTEPGSGFAAVRHVHELPAEVSAAERAVYDSVGPCNPWREPFIIYFHLYLDLNDILMLDFNY